MWNRMRGWLHRSDKLDEELECHLTALREERLAAGATPDEAERYAHSKLGNRTRIMESVHEMSPWNRLEDAVRQLRLAARAILRRKGAYGAATCILAMGIGMSAAMYSLVDAVLLRPLPFPRQESIEMIWKEVPRSGSYVEELAYPELRDLQDSIHDFEYVALLPTSLYGYSKVLKTRGGESVQIESTPVSHDFFRVLGVRPILGRNFTSSDERVGAAPVVMLSNSVWRQHLDADPRVVGRMIELNGTGCTVIGVMAPGIEFPTGTGMWVPLGVEQNLVTRRNATFLQAIARARPGVAHTHIAGQVDGLVRRLAVQYPQFYASSQRAVVTPLAQYLTGSARMHLWILLGASLLLLLAAIVSASNLLLSQVLARRAEIATRLALGARGVQILSQLAVEGLLIASSATVAGLGLAWTTTRALAAWAPADIPRLANATVDWHSYAFAVTAALAATLACTLIPGWAATRMRIESVLREGGERLSASRHTRRARDLFVVTQAALTVVALALAGLFMLSYHRMMTADIGFANRDAVSMNLVFRRLGDGPRIDAGARRELYWQLLRRLRESPGVASAAAVLVRPLEGPIGWERAYEFAFEAGHKDQMSLPKANYEVVTPEYFRTVGTPLIEGRDFTEQDTDQSEPVIIISRALAERIRRAGHAPLGHRVGLAHSGGVEWHKVVGVSGEARHRNIMRTDADLFVPYRQATPSTNYVVIRGTRTQAELTALVRHELETLSPGQAVGRVATLGELIDANAARHRFNMVLLLWFGACSAVLAATGVYSVVAESVASRRQEIAIRIALGAWTGRLVRQVLERTIAAVAAGAALGALAVALGGRLLSELLYRVTPHNPQVLGGALLFVLVATACSGLRPAWTAVTRANWKNGRI